MVKDSVSGLRQFLATDSPWKSMKNALKFKFLSWLYGNVEKMVWLER